MIKVVLMVILFGTSGYLGFQTAKVYEIKQNFFIDILSFTKSIKNEISFLKTDLFTILKKYQYDSAFNNFLIGYQKLLNSKKITQNDMLEILQKNISLNGKANPIACALLESVPPARSALVRLRVWTLKIPITFILRATI